MSPAKPKPPTDFPSHDHLFFRRTQSDAMKDARWDDRPSLVGIAIVTAIAFTLVTAIIVGTVFWEFA